jgi:hypothetical protein
MIWPKKNMMRAEGENNGKISQACRQDDGGKNQKESVSNADAEM